uniref:Ovule protein n=1 Tax=Syphacia muris TaxID=451379 RepID=A0A0N5AFR8_9BILA
MSGYKSVEESVELQKISEDLTNNSIENAFAELSAGHSSLQPNVESSSEYIDPHEETVKLLKAPVMESVAVQVDMVN